MADGYMPDPQEVTLADIVQVLWRRKYVLLAVFLLTIGTGVAYTVVKTPEYTSTSTLVPLEQQDIIQRWIESRQAATWVAAKLGNPLQSRLFPDEWSAASNSWAAQPPSKERAGQELAKLVTVTTAPAVSGRIDRTLTVKVVFTDAKLARDVANAYLDSLEVIRPTLQNVTESALFAQFYDGQNAQDARRQAHEVALEREYWIVVDPAYAAVKPSSPNVPLNIALSVVLGAMLAVMAGFAWEWAANYRLSARAPVVPEVPRAMRPTAGEPFRYRGK